MESITIPAKRTIIIDLVFPSNIVYHWPLLNRWLNRADHPTKKGTKVDFQYVFSDRSKRPILAGQYWNMLKEMSRWEGYMSMKRASEEIEKMMKALQ